VSEHSKVTVSARTSAAASRIGGWLAALGQETGLVGASVTIETAPDTGHRLEREVNGHIELDVAVGSPGGDGPVQLGERQVGDAGAAGRGGGLVLGQAGTGHFGGGEGDRRDRLFVEPTVWGPGQGVTPAGSAATDVT